MQATQDAAEKAIRSYLQRALDQDMDLAPSSIEAGAIGDLMRNGYDKNSAEKQVRVAMLVGPAALI